MEGLIIFMVLLVAVVPVVMVVMAVFLHRHGVQIERLGRRLDRLEGARPAAGVQPESPAAEPAQTAAAIKHPTERSLPSKTRARPAPPTAPITGTTASPPEVPPARHVPAPATPRSGPAFNWENFLGAKLYAWIAGFLLFLGVAFLLKYSLERNLVSPEMRIGLGYLAGIGLLAAGVWYRNSRYKITTHTLCATGVVVLYAASYAAHSVYGFTGPTWTFVLMTGITVVAFFLAAGMGAMAVAILGLVGGFLTPLLLSTGSERAFALFSYITFLNLGLLALAWRRQWEFLLALGAMGTILIEGAWLSEFFRSTEAWKAVGVLHWFNGLYAAAYIWAWRIGRDSRYVAGPALGMSIFTLVFAFILLAVPSGTRLVPLQHLVLAFGADLFLLFLTTSRREWNRYQGMVGGALFFYLAWWTEQRLEPEQVGWALGAYVFFALLHAAWPLALARWLRIRQPVWTAHAFPLLAVLLAALPLLRGVSASTDFWLAVLLLNAVALAAAVVTAFLPAVLVALVLSAIVVGVWLFRLPPETSEWIGVLVVLGAYGLFFSLAGRWITEHLRRRIDKGGAGRSTQWEVPDWLNLPEESLADQVPLLSVLLPFALMILASSRFEVSNVAPWYGVALVLVLVFLAVSRGLGSRRMALPVLGGVFLAECALHWEHFHPAAAGTHLTFHLTIYLVFLLFPFLPDRCGEKAGSTTWPWIASALSGPLHFLLVHHAIKATWFFGAMGLVPLAFSIPQLAAFFKLLDHPAARGNHRLSMLAWFAGTALFFITVMIPVQFEEEWLTIGWALEGVALLWLFHRLPHPGLRGTGIVLLAVVFVRLGLNPSLLDYHPPGTLPILNWYLYTFGLAAACLYAGARLLAAPNNRWLHLHIPTFFNAMATILVFFLVNLEIADFFSDGGSFKFEFTGNFAQGMTYSIAWATFALVLLVAGIWKNSRGTRLASLGLVALTLAKLFFSDLRDLEQLYRIGAFIGVAIILLIASILYQRFVVAPENTPSTGEKTPPA